MRPVIVVAAVLFGGTFLTACPSSAAPNGAGHGNASPTSSGTAAKGEVVDDIPLIPITSAQRGQCVKFADRLRRQVPCPGLLPKPIPVSPTSSASSCLGAEDDCGPASIQTVGELSFSQSNFQVPPGYVGVTFQQYSGAVVPETSISGGPLGHFVFTARKGAFQAIPPYCSLLQEPSPIKVHGSAARLYQCADSGTSPGENELVVGHDMLVWDVGGITTEVSFHGHSQVNVDLDVAVADGTELVSPTNV